MKIHQILINDSGKLPKQLPEYVEMWRNKDVYNTSIKI